MKTMIMTIALLGAISFGTEAQTNRTYNTNMQDQNIRAAENRGGGITDVDVKLKREDVKVDKSETQMKSVQKFEGYKNYEGRSQGNLWWDTSKSNGHCLGCGSDASWKTDHIYNPETNEIIFKK